MNKILTHFTRDELDFMLKDQIHGINQFLNKILSFL